MSNATTLEADIRRLLLPHERLLREEARPLPVPLTQEELLARGQQLAQVEADVMDHLARAEGLKRELKAKEASLEAERARLANIVRQKKEQREVLVRVVADDRDGTVAEVRLDSGEVLSTRPQRVEERQKPLPLGDA